MRRSAQPAWLVFLIAIALVLGAYYLWQGFRNYLQTGGLGVIEATEQAEIQATATANQIVANPSATLRPTFTPIPACKEFAVAVPSAIVRERANTSSPIVTSWGEGTLVCMIDRAQENEEWYVVDGNPRTRRIEFAYMHESVIQAVNPTLTPSNTPTPLATVTLVPTEIPSVTSTSAPTATIDPDATDTPTVTPSPSPTDTLTPTVSFQSA